MPNIHDERRLALSVLTDITENGAYANQALRKALADSPLPARGRAFVTEIVNETVRNLLYIDAVINAFSNTPTEKMKPFIKNLLRISVCQLRFMDKVPPSAAVNEAVSLAKKQGFGNLSGFVNGVLRSIVRQPDKPALPILNIKASRENVTEYISARFSYPAWLAETLVESVGAEAALSAAEAGHKPPSVTVFANTLRVSPEELSARLTEEGTECEPGAFHAECLKLRRVSDITRSPAFNDGLFFVIDEGAVSAVKMLKIAPGMNVLDMCAAPGGKTFAAMCLMKGEGRVTAWDVHAHKIDLLNAAANRLGFKNIRSETADALKPNPPLYGGFDAVLLDAPCSGLGIIRKKPDIKYNRKPEDIAELAAVQRGLLTAAAEYVKPGGVLLYCTCTLTREENGGNIEWFTENFPFEKEYENLMLTTEHNDGFYIARMRKRNG